MADVLLVLNAGSSSLKFSLFLDRESPEVLVRGQLEGLFTRPRFVARDRAGSVAGENEWPGGMKLGHDGAIDFLFTWGREHALGGHQIVAAGHRVAHGGRKYTRPASGARNTRPFTSLAAEGAAFAGCATGATASAELTEPPRSPSSARSCSDQMRAFLIRRWPVP